MDYTRGGKPALHVACAQCPIHDNSGFRDFSREELDFVAGFKRGELVAEGGSTIFVEGTNSPHLYTVLSGWGFRSKTLEDGRRQIVNFVMPGDFIGLQGSLLAEMGHSIEALSPMLLCVFERERLFELFRDQPSLGYDVTWLAAQEEQMLDEHLLSVGRRSALERLSYLLAFLHERAAQVGLFRKRAQIAPLTQQQVADTLGLSLVHTNKTVRTLRARGLISWHDASFVIRDLDALREAAGWDGLPQRRRPFI